jgi:hypothetical protein
MPGTTIGAELQEVQFGELVRSVAQGIADGQHALDLAAIETLQALANTPVSIIPEITEVITPAPFQVNISGQAPVTVTGARVDGTASEPVQMSALQAGLSPTFYQFAEATIQLKVAISLRETQEQDSSGTLVTGLRAFGANVNFRTQNTYGFSVDASAQVNVTMRPVPPPRPLTPATVTVNALGPKPVVTTSL